jgi:hypothetical protein
VNGDKVIRVNLLLSNLKLDVGGKQEKQLLAAAQKVNLRRCGISISL